MPRQAIRRGIIQSFNNLTYQASVLIIEATDAFLTGVPVANHIDGTSGLVGAYCAVLFFDEQNYTDAVVIACYQNGSNGQPAIPPGRITFVTGFRQINGAVINAGSTSTFTLTGAGGIPSGALGVIYKIFFSSPTVGAFLQFGPHGASDITAYGAVGNIEVAGSINDGCGLVQVDANGQLDIKAGTGNCTVTLYTHGYVI